MMSDNLNRAMSLTSSLLNNTQLDEMRISSLIISLGFYNENPATNMPSYLWLRIMGRTYFKSLPSSDDFFELRKFIYSNRR